MANDQITGNVTGKIRFTIDKASWNNLETFQKKLTSIKKQMSNLDKTINVNAVVKSVEKIATAQVKATEKVVKVQKKAAKEGWGIEFGRATGSNKEYASWWKDTLAIQDKGLKESIRQQKNHIKQQQQMVKQANARAGMGGRLAWMFPSGGVSNKASGTLFAQMLRDEENAAKEYDRWWNNSLRNEEKRIKAEDRLVKQQERLARKQGKGKGLLDKETFERKVNTFMEVKTTQLKTEAIRKGYHGTAQYKANEEELERAKIAAFKAAFTDKGGDIELFRARVNTAIRTMHTMERTAAANKITFASLRGELVQLTAAYGAFAVAQNIVQTGFAFEGLRASAKVFAKDEAGVAEHMNFIREQAYRLGVDLQTATKEFTKFSIATKSTLSKKDQRELFVGISEYARVMGASQSDYERAFRAVQQIECCLPTQ